jgi:hypothetical protein
MQPGVVGDGKILGTTEVAAKDDNNNNHHH